MFVDYYNVLGLLQTATETDIKKAYRKLAMQYHPDRNKDSNAAQKFIEITIAYEVLVDPLKRAAYNSHYTFHKSREREYTDKKSAEYQQQKESWREYGRKKAEEYSSMPLNIFLQKIGLEIKLGIEYIPNLIFVFICVLGAISGLSSLPRILSEKQSVPGFKLVIILVVVGFSLVAYLLIKRMRIDYLKERSYLLKKNKY